MLLSFTHRLLLVRPAKVGGTSIEMFLQSLCWPGTVVKHEQPRIVHPDGYVSARMSPKAVPSEAQLSLARAWSARFPSLTGGKEVVLGLMVNHADPAKLQTALGAHLWSNLHRVSIVRNLYDVEVSRFFWRNRFDLPSTLDVARERFEEFVGSVGQAKTNAAVIDSLDNFHTIIHFERMKSDLEALVIDRQLHSTQLPLLPREKSGYRPQWARDFRDLYTQRAKGIVTRKYRRQIERMGYEC